MVRKTSVTFILILFIGVVMAQTGQLRKKNYNIKNGIAIGGYDPVSYFHGNPEEGVENFQYSYKDITYFFSSGFNLNKFKAEPEKYEPAYGGWCAYAMGETGEKVKVDPETFKIVNGRLYLFYNFWANNTLEDWNKNERELTVKADNNWNKFFR